MKETLEEMKERELKKSARAFRKTGQTKEERLAWLKKCEEIKNTIKFDELELICYLRNGRRGDFYMYHKTAILNYQALLSLKNLFKMDDKER